MRAGGYRLFFITKRSEVTKQSPPPHIDHRDMYRLRKQLTTGYFLLWHRGELRSPAFNPCVNKCGLTAFALDFRRI